jgi:hypothetical protein
MTNLAAIAASVIFSISMLSPGTANATDASRPQDLLAAIQERGPRAVVDELWDSDEKWAALETGVGTGTKEWLKVARAIKPGTDAASSETLEIAMFRAIHKSPWAVLSLLASEPQSWFGVCSSNFLMGDPADERALGLLDRTIDAIEKVEDNRLSEIRKSWLAGLEDGRRVVLEEMQQKKIAGAHARTIMCQVHTPARAPLSSNARLH